MNKFLQWQNNAPSTGKNWIYLAIGALIFPITIPVLLVMVLPRLDQALGWTSFSHGWINIIAGVLMMILGGFIAFSTVIAQIRFASGTPFPMMPTRKLLVGGPFRYCRNPMTLGTVLLYAGIAVWVGSFSALLFVALFALALILYLKLVEEKELALRFGQEYLDYKKVTPFMLPIRIASRKKD